MRHTNPLFNRHALLTYIADGRNERERPLHPTSLRAVIDCGDPCVRMYNTFIARFMDDDKIVVRANGWEDSNTTRSNIATVTGLNIFSLHGSMKRKVRHTTRAYAGHIFPHGVPFEDGVVVRNGAVVYHPEMERQGILDITQMTEEITVEDKVKSRPYREARRALVERLRPFRHFISDASIESVATVHRPTSWFEAVLDSTTDDELYGVACQLVVLGMPEYKNRWQRRTGVTPETIDQYLQRGITACVGPSSWNYLTAAGMTKTERVLCTEV